MKKKNANCYLLLLFSSFISSYNVINYFDKFNLLSSKYLNYLKWREAYLLLLLTNSSERTFRIME